VSYTVKPYAIDCARRAAERAATLLHHEFGRGRSSLLAIACIAPLLGMFGTAVLLVSALLHPLICDLCPRAGPAEALTPITFSLPVAIFASSGFHFLRHKLESFDLEMRTATLDLLNHLARPLSGRS
jgi:biopolymer transport protein ExbB/TolQ